MQVPRRDGRDNASVNAEVLLPGSQKLMATDSFFIHLLPEDMSPALLICRWVN